MNVDNGILRVEGTHFPKNTCMRVRDKLHNLRKPLIMGILNSTPDSFYAASRKGSDATLLSTVQRFIDEGMDVLDIGGYSTRPGANAVSQQEEIRRIQIPIQQLKKEFPSLMISLDTFRGEVAKVGIGEGVSIINDISGGEFDPALLDVVSKEKVPYILMYSNEKLNQLHHVQENVQLFQDAIFYFSKCLKELTERGIYDVLIDPGFGFGKSIEQNYELLYKLELFHLLERPLLVGLSRKSMIYKKLNSAPEEALNGTTVLNTLALLKGASVLRVHDVKEAKEIIDLLGG